MGKGLLHLYIDNELVEIGKKQGINLSQEFEAWLRNRITLPSLYPKANIKEIIQKEIIELQDQITMKQNLLENEKLKDKTLEEIDKKQFEEEMEKYI